MPSPKLSFLNRADLFYPWLLFVCLALVAALLTAVPWPELSMNVIFPNLMVMVLFIWALLRPELCQFSLFFAIGIWQDLLLAVPLGLHGFLNILLLLSSLQVRAYVIARGFLFMAAAYAMLSFIYLALLYAIAGMLFGYHFTFSVFMFKWLGGNLLMPILFAFILWMHRIVVNMVLSR